MIGSPESLVEFRTLFPKMAIEMNSAPTTTHTVNPPIPSSAQGAADEGRPCDGNRSIKRPASTIASDEDHCSLFDCEIVAAKLCIA
ncbi:hypothetical protein [Bradyrhizobium sp. Rc2d]|uniref:hypothetical protein n=1 Tax=Bradyrhizobium sp. Rc2d TaxID=1855321 RepID=UPI00115FB714|nr:hypothetical protein [Bradyrhizobium sp. Rc2d]